MITKCKHTILTTRYADLRMEMKHEIVGMVNAYAASDGYYLSYIAVYTLLSLNKNGNL